MATPHRCPVCYGTGQVTVYDGIPIYPTTGNAAGLNTKICHACSGKGIVWEESPIRYIPMCGSGVAPLTVGEGVAPLTVGEQQQENLMDGLKDLLNPIVDKDEK